MVTFPREHRVIAVALLSLVLVASCGGKNLPPPVPPTEVEGYKEKGMASWYGNPYHGRKTANGERYDMYQMTAAHKTLPFGTVVRVINLENGKKVEVRINDRGPFKKGRIIDLSYASAKKLDMIGPGVVKVKVVVVKTP